MATLSFDNNVSVNITFAADVPRFDAFGRVVLLIPADPSDSDLLGGSDRYKVYSSRQAVNAAVATSELTAALAAQLNVAWLQDRAPSEIVAARFDSLGAGTEDSGDALDALDADGVAYYGAALLPTGTTVDDEAESTIFAAEIDARNGASGSPRVLGAIVLDGANMLDGSIVESAGSLETAATSTRNALYYHDDTTPSETATGAVLGFANLVARLGYDPDLTTQSFEGSVRGITNYSTLPSSTERSDMEDANINLLGTFGAVPYVSPGRSLSGRPLGEQLSVDWFAIRLAEDLRQVKLNRDAIGEILPLNREGQEAIAGEFSKRRQIAGALNKVDPDPDVTFLNLPDPIPAADIAAERFTGTGQIKLVRGGRIIDIDLTATV